MSYQTIKTNSKKGRFVKGQSGNPKGRPKGSTGYAAELKRLEDDALTLACHVSDIIAETFRLALTEIERPEFISLFDTICACVKDGIKNGEIGPSSMATIRTAYDNGDKSFFIHSGLPSDCDWPTFEKHYRTRGRIDFDRYVEDLNTYPPILQRIKELTQQDLIPPVIVEPSNKFENGFD